MLSTLPPEPIAAGIAARRAAGSDTLTTDKVLWLHGYTLDSSSWGELWSLLPGWRHIGVDLPGHGASAPVSPDGDLRQLGRRLGELCRRERIRHIVALSFGTLTALQIGIEMPAAFATLTLGAPSIAGGPQDQEVGRVYMQLAQLYHRSRAVTAAAAGTGTGADDADAGIDPATAVAMRERWMACRAWRGVDRHPGLREALASLVDRHRWAELNGFATRQFTHPAQSIEAIAAIRAAMLVLVGDREMSAFRDNAALLRDTVPGCVYHELADTDHLCMLMSPAPSARRIDTHLRAHAERPPPAPP